MVAAILLSSSGHCWSLALAPICNDSSAGALGHRVSPHTNMHADVDMYTTHTHADVDMYSTHTHADVDMYSTHTHADVDMYTTHMHA